MPLFQAKNIRAGYGDVVIIDDVSINVANDHLVVIVGPNGSGKSTLLKSLIGLVHRFSGTVFYGEHDLTKTAPWQATSLGIGYVPQVDNVFTKLTVHENLEMGAYSRRDKEGIQADLAKTYERFPELAARKKALAETLSGGEKQMLAIARAMMPEPKILLLDEPLAFLSPKSAGKVLNKLLQIQKDGTAILMVEQNAVKALQNASYGYVLNEGRCVMEGTGAELLANKSLREKFLGLGNI